MRLGKVQDPVGKQFGAAFPGDSSQAHGVQDLKKRVHDLEDEVWLFLRCAEFV